jgi:hypothetical protein
MCWKTKSWTFFLYMDVHMLYDVMCLTSSFHDGSFISFRQERCSTIDTWVYLVQHFITEISQRLQESICLSFIYDRYKLLNMYIADIMPLFVLPSRKNFITSQSIRFVYVWAVFWLVFLLGNDNMTHWMISFTFSSSTRAAAWTPDEIYYALSSRDESWQLQVGIWSSRDESWQLQVGIWSFQTKTCNLC